MFPISITTMLKHTTGNIMRSVTAIVLIRKYSPMEPR